MVLKVFFDIQNCCFVFESQNFQKFCTFIQSEVEVFITFPNTLFLGIINEIKQNIIETFWKMSKIVFRFQRDSVSRSFHKIVVQNFWIFEFFLKISEKISWQFSPRFKKIVTKLFLFYFDKQNIYIILFYNYRWKKEQNFSVWGIIRKTKAKFKTKLPKCQLGKFWKANNLNL